MVWQIVIGHCWSAWSPPPSACCFVESDTSVIRHVFMYYLRSFLLQDMFLSFIRRCRKVSYDRCKVVLILSQWSLDFSFTCVVAIVMIKWKPEFPTESHGYMLQTKSIFLIFSSLLLVYFVLYESLLCPSIVLSEKRTNYSMTQSSRIVITITFYIIQLGNELLYGCFMTCRCW